MLRNAMTRVVGYVRARNLGTNVFDFAHWVYTRAGFVIPGNIGVRLRNRIRLPPLGGAVESPQMQMLFQVFNVAFTAMNYATFIGWLDNLIRRITPFSQAELQEVELLVANSGRPRDEVVEAYLFRNRNYNDTLLYLNDHAA